MSFAVWQYHCDGFWQSYDQPASDQIEAARLAGVDMLELTEGIFSLSHLDHTIYEVMPALMLQRNKLTGTCRHMRRLQATIDAVGAGPLDSHTSATTAADPLKGLLEPVKCETLPDDAQCNICISTFDDEEAPPIRLPKCQGHWYHADCIEAWLAEKQQCPYCKQIYGILRGNCPDGHFEVRHLKKKLPGFNGKRPAVSTAGPSAASLIAALNASDDATVADMDMTSASANTSGSSNTSDFSGSLPSSATSSAPVSPSKRDSAEYSTGTWMLSWSIPSGIQTVGHQNPGQYFSGTYRQAYLPDTPAYRDILKMFQLAWQRKLMFTVGRSLTRNVDNVVIWAGIHCRTEWHNHGGFGWPCASYAQTVTDEFRNVGITPDQML